MIKNHSLQKVSTNIIVFKSTNYPCHLSVIFFNETSYCFIFFPKNEFFILKTVEKIFLNSHSFLFGVCLHDLEFVYLT